jgi:ribonuclease R
MDLIRGRLQAHAKGFGFLLPEDKQHPDVYIHANDLLGAMNNDTILVKVTSRSAHGGKLEGEVVRIVTRKNSRLVGTFQNHESYGFVLPDDKRIVRDILIPKDKFNGAVDGQKVVVNIVVYPQGRAAAEGEITEILGHKDDPGVDILSVIRKFQLPESFSDEVAAEANAAPESITEDELKGRRDLRDKTIVTIDGEDAKDLDDAVHVEQLDNGNVVLGVHIADVGYYVREGSQLDQEAYQRGCSVYLVDRVIPMLPHRLSNGICSLNPKVDRLTMSCEMEFDAGTNLVRHEIFTSVIKTKERMTYTNVRKLLTQDADRDRVEGDKGADRVLDEVDKGADRDRDEGDKGTSGDGAYFDEYDAELFERYAYLMDDFRRMEKLAMRLRARRMKRGAIDFDFQEAKILVDADGKPTDIVKRERSIAESMIEEFMLAANETVAEHFHWLKVPFLYRVHEDPDAEKLLHFVTFVANFGYVVRGKGNTVHPKALQALLEEIKGTKEETVISTVLLRSMKQARYDANSLGHFGLSAEFYSHFTSPIRRYPDLIIHRVIREVLELGGAMKDKRHEYLTARMEDIARQSSERERVAVDAEREVEAMKKAEFMMDKVGEEFDGMISSVTSFGMFIELDNTVEGLIRLSDMSDDYYHYHEAQHTLIGERTSKIYRIGDEVQIRVARVNKEDHTIDFEMVNMKPGAKKMRLVDGLAGMRSSASDVLGAGAVDAGKAPRRRRKAAAATAAGASAGGELFFGSQAGGLGTPKKKKPKGTTAASSGNAGGADSIPLNGGVSIGSGKKKKDTRPFYQKAAKSGSSGRKKK